MKRVSTRATKAPALGPSPASAQARGTSSTSTKKRKTVTPEPPELPVSKRRKLTPPASQNTTTTLNSVAAAVGKQTVEEISKTALRPSTASDFRAWLEQNHTTSPPVWVAMLKKASGRQTVNFRQLLDEALCFGWIDSRGRKLSDLEFAIRFDPRKNKAPKNWSVVNRENVRRLIKENNDTSWARRPTGGL